MRSLLTLGHGEEAGAFLDWMLHVTRLTWPELQASAPDVLRLSAFVTALAPTGVGAHVDLKLATPRSDRQAGHAWEQDLLELLVASLDPGRIIVTTGNLEASVVMRDWILARDLPILVGGSAKPGTAGPAVRFADEYNALFGTLDQVRERKQLLDEACERGGRDPSTLRYSLMAPCVIGRNEQEVLESARRIGARFGRDPEDVLERYREHGPVGTIAQAVERLKQIEEIGYERVMLQHLAHDDLETVALIGRELAPAVA
jgi:hypothetical protein